MNNTLSNIRFDLSSLSAGYFYSGSVEAVDFGRIDEEIRERTNRLVTMKTDGRVKDFMHHDHPKPEAPLALFAANYFKVIQSFF